MYGAVLVQSINEQNTLGTTGVISSGEAHPFSLPEWHEHWMGHPHNNIIITGTFEMIIIWNLQQDFSVRIYFSCGIIVKKAQFYLCYVIYTTENLELLENISN